jgi:hypothetical protein
VFNCFSKASGELQKSGLKPHGATGSFSKASWGVCTNFQEALEKPFVAPTALEQLLHTTVRGFREIYENSKAFGKG